MRGQKAEVDAAGIGVVAVATGAPHQAANLQPDYPFPLLVDSDRALYRALHFDRLRPRDWIRPSTYRHYVGPALRGWQKQGRLTSPAQLGGVVVADAENDVCFLHRMQSLGDYPDLSAVIDAARSDCGGGR